MIIDISTFEWVLFLVDSEIIKITKVLMDQYSFYILVWSVRDDDCTLFIDWVELILNPETGFETLANVLIFINNRELGPTMWESFHQRESSLSDNRPWWNSIPNHLNNENPLSSLSDPFKA